YRPGRRSGAGLEGGAGAFAADARVMADSTPQSEVILRQARQSLATQQDGGFHRRAGSGSRAAIGQGSAGLRARHLARKLKRIIAAVAAILMGAIVAGLIVDGIGFVGIMVSVLLIVCAIAFFSSQ